MRNIHFVKVECQDVNHVYALYPDRKAARRTRDSADMIRDPLNAIHRLPRAELVKGGVRFNGADYATTDLIKPRRKNVTKTADGTHGKGYRNMLRRLRSI